MPKALIVYASRTGETKKIGELKLLAKNKRVKIIYDKNSSQDIFVKSQRKTGAEEPDIKIEKMTFENGKLFIRLTGFLMRKMRNESTGHVKVRVLVKNRYGIKVFDQTRNVTAKEKVVNISINFAGLKRGGYDFVIDVRDMFTDKSATDTLQNVVVVKQ